VSERARPPDDIAPLEFFTRWLPESVAADAERRARIAGTRATLVFELTGEQGGTFTVRLADGGVSAFAGREGEADLEVSVDVATWRALNRGELSAPEALVRRRVKLTGDLLLALKLHLILG
jgi:putative sterol carrier protein